MYSLTYLYICFLFFREVMLYKITYGYILRYLYFPIITFFFHIEFRNYSKNYNF